MRQTAFTMPALAATVRRRVLATPSRGTAAVAARDVAGWLLYAAIPLFLTALFVYEQARLGTFHFDFVGTVWEPSRAIVAGQSPYPPPIAAAVDVGNPAVYPPSVALVGAPLLVLPYGLAAALWTAVLVAAVALALGVLGVRDWRCYVLALSSFPVLAGAVYGNVTLLLVAGVALAWRYRDRAVIAGAALGLAVALKLFLWPLGVWLLATRRSRAALTAVAIAVAAVFLPWAAIGFAGLHAYPKLLRVATDVFASDTHSLVSAALALGTDTATARWVALAVGGLLLALAVHVARREDGDRRSFGVALGAALALSPIVWPPYFAFVLVVVALFSRRVSPLWLAVAGWWLIKLVIPLPIDAAAHGPASVPEAAWKIHAAGSPLWQTLAYNAVLAGVLAATTILLPHLRGGGSRKA